VSVTRIPVGGAGEESYEVVVGAGVLGEVPAMLPDAAQVLVLHAEPVRDGAAEVIAALQQVGCGVRTETLPGIEADKDVSTLSRLWDALGRYELSRSDAVVTVGGGSTTDLGGFAAATWLRGIRVVHVPTTLLGMVDAAIGGKTGINTAAGKNLVGAFHPPAGVACDLDFLATLPAPDYRAGLAEVVKAGFIADPAILDLIEGRQGDPRRHQRELVERAVRVKADVVSGDLREAGRREILNYGHTLGHALERVEGYRWRHGDAVAVGMVFAAELGRLTGRLEPLTAERHRAVLTTLRLPTSYHAEAWPALHAAMRLDKKSRGGRLRFVVLDGLARPGVLADPPPELLAAAYAEVARR
jgi:3-dehydroquinate synthase